MSQFMTAGARPKRKAQATETGQAAAGQGREGFVAAAVAFRRFGLGVL